MWGQGVVVMGDIVLGLDKAASGHDCQLGEEGESYLSDYLVVSKTRAVKRVSHD